MEGWAVRSGLPCKTPMDGGGYRIIVSADAIHEQGGRDKERGETEGADKERNGKEGTERHRLTSSRPISFKATKR